MKIRTFVTVLTLAFGSAAFAQAPAVPKDPMATPRIDQRQANQEKRIEQGVASGQLTPREANRLERKQDRIAHVEQRAKSDGAVTAQERKHLTKMENHTSRDIRRERHDAQRDMNHDGKRDHKGSGHHGVNKS